MTMDEQAQVDVMEKIKRCKVDNSDNIKQDFQS
jgi:hypothetical protein